MPSLAPPPVFGAAQNAGHWMNIQTLYRGNRIASGLVDDTVAQECFRRHIPFNVLDHVQTDGRSGVDGVAKLAINLVPGPADLFLQIAAQGRQILVETLAVARRRRTFGTAIVI